MNPKLSIPERYRILKRVLTKKEPIARICRETGISRTLVYRWLRIYSDLKKFPNLKKTAAFTQLLKASVKPKKGRILHKAHYEVSLRIRVIEDFLRSGKKINQICKDGNLTKTIFYKWLNRYLDAGLEKIHPDSLNFHNKLKLAKSERFDENSAVSALDDKEFKFDRYPQQMSFRKEKIILKLIAEHPELSCRKLTYCLPIINGKPIVSYKGVQNILRRYRLNTYNNRLIFSQSQVSRQIISGVTQTFDQVKSVWETFVPNLAPAPPPFDTAQGKPSSAEVPDTFIPQDKPTPFPISILNLLKLFINAVISIYKLPFKFQNPWWASSSAFIIVLFTSAVIAGNVYYVNLFTHAANITVLMGLIFASSALFFGSVFFLYSMKYYINIIIILLYSRKAPQGSGDVIPGLTGDLSNEKNIDSRFRGNDKIASASGLIPDLSNITLTRHPFVSIHLPLYNEKRVVNRLLEAVTSMDYDNYEVIVADDSTDETRNIVWEWKNHPLIKISHRDNRAGYKGGALREAMKLMDKRAEFVLVFDSDFLPYPDTITQFLKYFQVVAPVSNLSHLSNLGNIAAVQGYQWHVLNKSENWITRGVRTEYAGSYVIERSSNEICQGLKQIAGSVFMIRADLLKQYQWGTSITEDFELTLKLYRNGYKVVYTPYIQAPSECVSTLKRLIRQRMRWAEGHSFNIKLMFLKLLRSPIMSIPEKLEFIFLAPYYLQSAFLLVGTFFWFVSESVFRIRLPFWTAIWGWSLVLTSLFSLPLMNLVGLFLEEAEEKDYAGLFAFILLTYIVAPFQAYAAIKGFLENSEGPWFRTPKTGKITDVFKKGGLYGWISKIFGRPAAEPALKASKFAQIIKLTPSTLLRVNKLFSAVSIRYIFSKRKWVGNTVLASLLIVTTLLANFSRYIPMIQEVKAAERKIGLIKNAKESHASEIKQVEETASDDGDIKGETMLRIGKNPDKQVEYIFHSEPRIRTKYEGKEIEITLTGAEGLGQENHKTSVKEQGKYVYQDIFSNIDVSYTPENETLTEEITLKNYQDIKTIEYHLETKDLSVALLNNEVHFAPSDSGSPLITFTRPLMYEQGNSDNTSNGLEYTLEKDTTGWKLKKVLTQEGTDWLKNSSRQFPVVIDPTSVIQGSISTAESDYGQQQRKIIYADTASGGAAWYAVYEDAGNIFLEKSTDGSSWTDPTDVDGSSTGSNNPSLWWEADQNKIWVTWANNAADNLQFRYIDVGAASPGTLGALCTGADQTNHNPTTWLPTIAVAASAGATDDIFVTYVDTSTSTVNNIYRIDVTTLDTSSCTVTWNTILANSGVDAGDRPIALPIGNTLHLIFQDGADLKHSVTNNDGGTEWDRADYDITGGSASNTSLNYSAATDGTNIWLLVDQGVTGTDLWICSNCSSGASWTNSDSTDPWTADTDATEVSITYVSGTTDLVTMILVGTGTNEQAYFKTSDSASISWGSQWDFGYAPGASGLEDLSSPMSSTTADGVASTVEDATASEYEFSTLPENLWLLFLIVPGIVIFKRYKMSSRARNERGDPVGITVV